MRDSESAIRYRRGRRRAASGWAALVPTGTDPLAVMEGLGSEGFRLGRSIQQMKLDAPRPAKRGQPKEKP